MDHRVQRVQQTVTYEFNGVKYSRLEDMPPEVREHFVDRDGNGIPDTIDAALKRVDANQSIKTNVMRVERRVLHTTHADDPIQRLRVTDPDLARVVAAHDILETVKCGACGYDLKGTAIGGKCPECGQSVTRSLQSLIDPQPSRSSVIASVVLGNIGWIIVGLLMLGFLIWRIRH